MAKAKKRRLNKPRVATEAGTPIPTAIPKPVKQLLLVRHAKSSWQDLGLADHLRPLSARGYRQGAQLAERLPVKPEYWLCSNAVRTYSTAMLLGASPLFLKPQLYLAEVATLLAEIDALPEQIHCAGLIGHNPSLEALIFELTGQKLRLKTSEMALLQWQGDWSDKTELAVIHYPRNARSS